VAKRNVPEGATKLPNMEFLNKQKRTPNA